MTNEQGYPVGDGAYLVLITLTDLAGNVTSSSFTVIVDKTAPLLKDLSISNAYFSPFGIPSTATISFKADDLLGTWTYFIAANGILIEKGTETGSATVNFVWNGKGINGEQLSGGDYIVQVLVQDLAGNTNRDTVAVTIESIPPEIISFYASDCFFSPNGPKPSTMISFSAADNKEIWNYELTIDGKIPTGTGAATGSRMSTATVSFEWNGGYQVGTFSEGVHVVTLKVMDQANNVVTKGLSITIDNTKPIIGTISEDTLGMPQYLGEEIEFQMTTNEPAIATVILTTTEIRSAKEIISGKESFRLDDPWWDQYEIDTSVVNGSVDVYVCNSSGGTWSTFAIGSYTTPRELFEAINTKAFNNSNWGSVSYNAATDKIVFQAAPGHEIGLREYCDVAYKTPFFTQLKVPVVSVELIPYTSMYHKGRYAVLPTDDKGTWTVWGFVTDRAGNANKLKGPSIIMDGSRNIPVYKSRIIGMRVEPSPSKQFFNSSLKRMNVQMIVATIDEEFGEQNRTIFSGDTCFTLSSSKIKTGDRIIIWNDYIRDDTNKIVFDHGHVWTKIAATAGTITFSDADLYFGSPTGTYSTAVLKMRNFHVAIGTFTTEGIASFDLGNVENGIRLYDDGDILTHWDAKGRDGIFSNTYMVSEGIDIRDVPISGHFKDGRNYCVPNDGYPFNDEDVMPFILSEKNNPDPSNDIRVNIDTIGPVITLLGADITFNPLEGKKCEIKYTLTKDTSANTRIIIKTADGKIVRDLGSYQAKSGDNVCYWDGKNDLDNLVGDGKYYYHIEAADVAGNKHKNVFGVIVVTYVQMVLEEMVVIVPKALPGKGIDYVSINAVVSLNGTSKQLENLNFDTLPSNSVYNRPHALFDLTIYDRYGKEVQKVGPDMVDFTGAPFDSDPFPKGKPNYLIPPEDEQNWLMNPGAIGVLPDVGDYDKSNDWDIMVPFNKVDVTDTNEQHYKSTFRVTMMYYLDSPLKEGSFYVRGLAKLVSASWKFIEYDKDNGGNYIGEKWHCAPEYGHYGVHSQSIEQRFDVQEITLPHPDNIPPVVYESYPSNGVVVSPFEIKSNSMEKGIQVKVEDEGIGVDFHSESSYITLLDPDNMEVAGVPTNNGVDKLYLIIDKRIYPNGLEKPGVYTIKITVRDKAKNVTRVTRSFTILDKCAPDIESFSPKEGYVHYEGFALTLSAILSEMRKGKSGVDWGSSRITLWKDGREIDVQSYKIVQETDKNYGVLTYSLPQDFLKQGTYTMKILAWDIPNNPVSREVVFKVIRGIEIFFNHPELGMVPTLVFKPNTEMSFNGTLTVVSTQTITLQQAVIDENAIPGYSLFGKHVSVLIGTRSACGATFSQNVQLTIYYTETEVNSLPLTRSEKDLVLYGHDGTKWVLIPGASKGIYCLEPNTVLMSTYTLAFITPVKWTVRSGAEQEWGTLKSKEWMELVGTITTNSGIPIPNGSITIGIITDYASPSTGYKILSPVVAFYFKGERVIDFTESVVVKMHYVDSLPYEAKEENLTVFGYYGKLKEWKTISGPDVFLDKVNNFIKFDTKQTYEMYAIMYLTKEVPPDKKEETIAQGVWCYPNPAKGGRVNFRYYLAEGDTEITVKIYTLLGDLVWEDSMIEKFAGIHDRDFVWNCQNSSGEPVASGVYIYRLMIKPRSGSAATTVTKKLIVVQ
ncbi:MAG: FlgD immunoglobulin-like domain containing protein [bacterium]